MSHTLTRFLCIIEKRKILKIKYHMYSRGCPPLNTVLYYFFPSRLNIKHGENFNSYYYNFNLNCLLCTDILNLDSLHFGNILL